MIVHEHISMDARAEAFGQLREQFQQAEAADILVKEGLTFVPAGGEVIASASDLIAPGPCHANRKTDPRKRVNLNMSYVDSAEKPPLLIEKHGSPRETLALTEMDPCSLTETDPRGEG